VCRYPNGWYRLLDSSELKPGDVKHVEAAGQQLAVYRGKNSSKVYVMDAYCPHLGANRAVGGRVDGDCLECPFHLWQFNGAMRFVCVALLLPPW
jgi:cholesterol 7-dehydrogenase